MKTLTTFIQKTLIQKKTGIKLVALPCLSPDGLRQAPDGSFYTKGQWHKTVSLNQSTFTNSNIEKTERFFSEKVSAEQLISSQNRGGIIVFPAKFNAGSSSDLVFTENIKALILNSGFKNSVAFSTGNFFKGKYLNKENNYNEQSLAIELLGLKSDSLLKLAANLAKAYSQQCLMIKDLNANKFYVIEQSQ